MSRARKSAQQRAKEEATRRRNSASHRALRRRAARGKGAVAAGVDPTESPATPATTGHAPGAHDPSRDLVNGDDVDGPASASSLDQVEEPVVAAQPGTQEEVPEGPGADEMATFAPITDEVLNPWDEDRDVAHKPVDDDPVRDESPAEETVAFDSVTDTTPLPPVAVTPPAAQAAAVPPARTQPPVAPTPADADTPLPEEPEPKGPTKRRMAWIIPFVIVGLAVLYVGAQALLSNTVPTSTETLGIAIGGMSVEQAEGEVEKEAARLESADLELRAAELEFALPAADAGLDIDSQATVAQVTGFTLAPDRLWAHVVGGGEVEPVTAIDREALAGALESAAAHVDGPAQDAGVTVADGEVTVVPGRSAITVDQDESATVVSKQWPVSQSIELVAQTEPPTITDEDAQAFATELESQTLAAPITLVGDDAQAIIEPATIATNSTVVSGPAGLALEVDGEGLTAAILEANPDLTTEGDNASVSFDSNHNIVIDEGTPGITLDAERMGEAVTVAAKTIDRIGELPYTAADPEVSAADLGLADFQERIVSFDTPLTSERVRTDNLRTAAASIEGVVLLPGETFDLTEVLSPISEEAGYRASGVIVNGILTQGMGGGLSQMATNAYNAGYFAGYELIEHRPHSVWFTRYPAGRESTMFTGSINVVFRNNTPYAAVLNSYVDGGRLYTDVWSTKHFEVQTAASARSNISQPGVKEVTSASCRPKSAGQPGFTITNTRTVLLEGKEVDKTSDTWTYRPDDAIKCVSPDKDESNDDD